MTLYPITISDLQFVESAQFISRFVSDFQNTTLEPATDVVFNKLYGELQVQLLAYNKGLLQIKAKAETQSLTELDRNRDRKIIMLRRSINVFSYSDVELEKQAYLLLKPLLRTYKNIENLNYEAETKALEILITELFKPIYLQAISNLNLNTVLNSLVIANDDFKKSFNQRSASIIRTEVYDAKELRNQVFDTYRQLTQYIVLMANNTEISFYPETLKVINNGRQYFAHLLAIRAGHKDKKKETNFN